MKLLIFLLLIVSTHQTQTDFGLPYLEEDFIQVKRKFGKPKPTRLTLIIHAKVRSYPGISIEVKENAPAISIQSGEVIRVDSTTHRSHFVIIDHGNNIQAIYYHLKDTKVKIGQSVKKGEIIGTSSNQGLTVVNCIGLEIKKNGERIDPETIIKLP